MFYIKLLKINAISLQSCFIHISIKAVETPLPLDDRIISHPFSSPVVINIELLTMLLSFKKNLS